MKKILAAAILCTAFTFSVQAQKKIFPAISNYGGMFDVPGATDKPDPSMEYKIISDADKPVDKPEEIYPALDHILRMYNLFAFAGVSRKKLQVELVLYSQAIFIVMNNDAYKKKYGVDNPNLKIIEEMKKAGIKVYACSQSMGKFGIEPSMLNPDVEMVYSRVTTLASRQLKGYAHVGF